MACKGESNEAGMSSGDVTRLLTSREASVLLDEVLADYIPNVLESESFETEASSTVQTKNKDKVCVLKNEIQTALTILHETGDWEERVRVLNHLTVLIEQKIGVDNEPKLDTASLVSVSKLDTASLIEQVLPHATDWSEHVRAQTMQLLGCLPGVITDTVLEALCSGIADHEVSVRCAAVSALAAAADHGDNTVIERLLKLFADGRTEVRDAALVCIRLYICMWFDLIMILLRSSAYLPEHGSCFTDLFVIIMTFVILWPQDAVLRLSTPARAAHEASKALLSRRAPIRSWAVQAAARIAAAADGGGLDDDRSRSAAEAVAVAMEAAAAALDDPSLAVRHAGVATLCQGLDAGHAAAVRAVCRSSPLLADCGRRPEAVDRFLREAMRRLDAGDDADAGGDSERGRAAGAALESALEAGVGPSTVTQMSSEAQRVTAARLDAQRLARPGVGGGGGSVRPPDGEVRSALRGRSPYLSAPAAGAAVPVRRPVLGQPELPPPAVEMRLAAGDAGMLEWLRVSAPAGKAPRRLGRPDRGKPLAAASAAEAGPDFFRLDLLANRRFYGAPAHGGGKARDSDKVDSDPGRGEEDDSDVARLIPSALQARERAGMLRAAFGGPGLDILQRGGEAGRERMAT